MCKRDMEELVSSAVADVLETMFFSGMQEEAAPEPGTEMIAVRVLFEGQMPGMVEIRICPPSARTLAATFLGEDEVSLTGVQVEQVVCELANMICGAIVSNAEFGGMVTLGSPELTSPGMQDAAGNPVCEQEFFIENGTLSVLLYTSRHV
jgi:CheY-specific phosphatase CheX